MRGLGFFALLLSSVALASPSEKLLLNRASAEELASLDGVVAADAAAIISLREGRGRLSSVEELRVLQLSDAALSGLRMGTAIEVTVQPEAPTQTFSKPEEVLAQFAHEPTIQQVHSWATDYANISPSQVQRWLNQSVAFATLPQVQLEYKYKDDFGQGFEYFDSDGASVTTPDAKLFPVIQDADKGNTSDYRVKLVWDLDKLIMSSERIRVINEAQDVVKLRDTVLSEVTRLYFERRRLQAERLLAPKADALARVKEELRLMELTANIDALTGGAFSQGLSRSGG